MIDLDFTLVPTYNGKTFHIMDRSFYPTDPIDVDSPTLEINIPEFGSYTIPFVPGESNFLDSTVLGITSEGAEELPDGIYVFRYSVYPDSINYVEKTIMRVHQLQEKFDNIFMELDFMQCDAELKRQHRVYLDTVHYYINGAIAAANNCATVESMKLYIKADKMLTRFNSSGCCGSNNFL